MIATWIPTDAEITEAAWYAAARAERRRRHRDRDRRARLKIHRGSTGREEDDDEGGNAA